MPVTKKRKEEQKEEKGTLENMHQERQSASDHQVSTPGWKLQPLASP